MTGTFVHETVSVAESSTIGKGTKIWRYTTILENVSLGESCNIGQNVVIGPDVSIGNGCKIQNNVSVYKGVTLEDEVFCGPGMMFTNVINPRAAISRRHEYRPTLVCRGASIGANVTIICGVTIGTYAFIGAGAVVTGDVPGHAIFVGNPARLIGFMCQCGEKLSDEKEQTVSCSVCGQTYIRSNGGIRLAQ